MSSDKFFEIQIIFTSVAKLRLLGVLLNSTHPKSTILDLLREQKVNVKHLKEVKEIVEMSKDLTRRSNRF